MEVEKTNTETQENLNLVGSDKQAKEENKDTNADVSKQETNENVSENKDSQTNKTELPKGVKRVMAVKKREKRVITGVREDKNSKLNC